MTLKALTIVVLRLFAIMYFAQTILGALVYIPSLYLQSGGLLLLFYPAGLLILAVLLWVVANRLAAVATKGIDGPIPFTALTREDIYCCAFVILGLDFVLGSVGSSLTELYQFIQIFAGNSTDYLVQKRLIAPLAKNAITLIAGLSCILGAPVWTRKLLHLEQKNEA